MTNRFTCILLASIGQSTQDESIFLMLVWGTEMENYSRLVCEARPRETYGTETRSDGGKLDDR